MSEKLRKGDQIHAAKEKFKKTTLAVAIVLVLIGAGVSTLMYFVGNNAGKNSGYSEAYSYWGSVVASSQAAATSTATETKAESETKTDAATKAEGETSAESETKAK